MHPVLSSVRALSWYLLAWLALAAALACWLTLAGLAPWRNALWFALPVCVAYAFVCPSAYYVCRAMPFARRELRVGIVLFAGSCAVAGGMGWMLCMAWNRLSLGLEQSWAGIVMAPTLGWVLFAGAAGVYLLSLLLHDVLIAMDQMHAAQRRDVQSQALAQQAELQMLRAQINPHFLFNCLNSISALTSSDAAGARAMTIALAQYFRQTLSLSEHSHIPLEQEIAHCQSFLDIEKLRFGSKLSVDTTLPDAARAALVPPMLLQPLVENAVKHGIAHRTDAGTVVIHVSVQEPWLHLRVENPLEPGAAGGSEPGTTGGIGLGLRNIGQRLRSLYGEQARITQHATPDRFVVELTLPFTNLAHGAER
jgi:two-component system sensor histidine kinase AlgZ